MQPRFSVLTSLRYSETNSPSRGSVELVDAHRQGDYRDGVVARFEVNEVALADRIAKLLNDDEDRNRK